MRNWKIDEWVGEIFYYFLGFLWNKILWVIGKKKIPCKIRKRWIISHQITYLFFQFLIKISSMFNHFPTFFFIKCTLICASPNSQFNLLKNWIVEIDNLREREFLWVINSFYTDCTLVLPMLFMCTSELV